jgi:predicted Zn-dependent peptidase
VTFLHTRLDNGLTVIGEHTPEAESVACGYFVKTGARDETLSVLGVSHFLEHMMFKGTSRRSAEDVNREFDELGARYNAFTSEETTVYYGQVLPEFQGKVLDLLTDMMRPSLRAEDFDTEKNVILEEIARYDDMPAFDAQTLARETTFGSHPLGYRVLGTKQSITDMARDDMHAYFEQRYSPGNMVLALAGAFDWDAALEQVVADTAGWQQHDVSRDVTAPAFSRERRVVSNDRLARVHLVWMTEAPSTQDEERYAAHIAASVVGDAVGSRMYWDLVDPGIVDDASMYYQDEDHSGVFATYASCSPENVAEVTERMHGLLDSAASDGVTDEEVARSQQKIASGEVLGSETPMGRLVPLGMAWTYKQEYLGMDEAIDRVLDTTKDEVNALLREATSERHSLLALGPIDSLD